MHGCHTLKTPRPLSFVSFQILMFDIVLSHLGSDGQLVAREFPVLIILPTTSLNLCLFYDKLYHVSINTCQKILKSTVLKTPLFSGKPFVDRNC